MDPWHRGMGDSALRMQIVAGSAAGIFADFITHPVSTIKTRLQIQGSGGGLHGAVSYRGVTHALLHILRNEGPFALYRGLGVVVVGAAPAQGLYFGSYEAAKKSLGGGHSGNFAAGVCAQLAGSVAWVPVEVVKERLQVEGQVKAATAYSGSFDAFRKILQHEGVVGLYRSFPIHQVPWIPFNGCYFAVYEKLKEMSLDAGYADANGNLDPVAQLSCGTTAGVAAGLVTNPVDVLKTRLQVANANPDMFPYSSGFGAAQHLLQHEGAAALMDGALARVLWLTPRLTLCVFAYERMKSHLF
ncbi:unnamed protein product [Effrenium voratum]|uniref:Mitochondrial carrier protein n=1 Tax=Effrenium voratum TaxID=2562239 RepID=A0AA36JIB8_9DINO|nr:unnamed protein product [Effrenium voratum]CAJ1405975.1 unnamed protein product [Effrenium voratum]CAJ1419486.1 unnamed protein product [Effrenium voratum]